MIQKIKRFDRPTLKILRDELEETLGQLSKKRDTILEMFRRESV